MVKRERGGFILKRERDREGGRERHTQKGRVINGIMMGAGS